MKHTAPLALLILATSCFAAGPQETLKKRYQAYNTCIQKGDAKGMGEWLQKYCSPKFTYTSFQKTKYDRATYVNGVLKQIAQTNKVLKSSTVVRNFEVSKNTVVVTIASEFKGLVAFDTRKLILTDNSVTYETWTQTGGDWKLLKVVQVNADTQMHQEGED
jgi:hypothetical protein